MLTIPRLNLAAEWLFWKAYTANHDPFAMPYTWDYLILTASNDRQASGYESQLAVRRHAGLLPDVGTALVVADPFGKRVGSGGSTLFCLMRVVEAEIQRTGATASDLPVIDRILSGLRVLILHAGGDSRRVPAYGPCGKIFSPVPEPPGKTAPGGPAGEVISTLFDRIYPALKDLPRGLNDAGQVIVAAGDALMLFDTAAVRFDRPGIVALGARATPEAASKHGVFCVAPDGRVRLFLQKPSLHDQERYGAIDADGRAVLDIGLMSLDARAAMSLFGAFDVHPGPSGPKFSASMEKLVLDRSLDLYREICCAMGKEATVEHHRATCVASGSSWTAEQLAEIHSGLSQVPFSAQVLPDCEFLHFGTTRQLITSGLKLLQRDCVNTLSKLPIPQAETEFLANVKAQYESEKVGGLSLNNRLTGDGKILGENSWVEGCWISAPLSLAGENVVVGVDIDSPLELPVRACLDVIAGEARNGRGVWFVRAYHVDDTFKDTLDRGATLGNRPLLEWLQAVGAKDEDIWDEEIPVAKRSLWNARVFPAVERAHAYCEWLWMFDPAGATAAQKEAFHRADRYSAAEIALLADMDAFYSRRMNNLCDTH
jgi:fucokinase